MMHRCLSLFLLALQIMPTPYVNAMGPGIAKHITPIVYIHSPHGWRRPDIHQMQVMCMRRIMSKNRMFEVVPVDDSNWKDLVKNPPMNIDYSGNGKEIIKLLLLKETGGIFVEDSVFINRMSGWGMTWFKGFFAMRSGTELNEISTMLLVAKKDNMIVEKWLEIALDMASSTATLSSGWLIEAFKIMLKKCDKCLIEWNAVTNVNAMAARCDPRAGSLPSLMVVYKCEDLCLRTPDCAPLSLDYKDPARFNLEVKYPWMFDRRFTVANDFSEIPGGRLFFLHIPKTGGSAVEVAGQGLGYGWGKFDRFYDGHNGDIHGKSNGQKICDSPWHEPVHVGRRPGPLQSFCLVREPIDKMLSEFNFRTPKDQCNDKHLEEWVIQKMSKVRVDRYMDDCHLLPQYEYTRSCDIVIPYDKELSALKLTMRARYNITFGKVKKVMPIYAKRCFAKESNFSTNALNLIKEFYEKDFEVYFKAKVEFGKYVKAGLQSAQVPDLCPEKEVCSKSDSKCKYSGCHVPWLDEKHGSDYKCITVGCSPMKTPRQVWG
eukprot:m.235188 g.235188  ORF g.235188 m.235188 type:complete len:544 (-) comp16040_c0_seq7:2537-4168(-)